MNPGELKQLFFEHFGREPEIMAVAPGRINLIGEHTDYNDGFVFPVAIDLQLFVAARRCEGPSRLFSKEVGESEPFDALTCEPLSIEGWEKYAAGMAWALRDQPGITNLEAVVVSQVPIGSGVSSSAAMELAFGVTFNELSGQGRANKELALLGQRAENDFVGVQCGIMDQMASAMGKKGKAMFMDTRSLDITYASIPSDLALVVLDTETPRALTDSAYNERRSQCERAASIMNVKALRDASLEQLEAKKDAMDETTYRRAKHVISENARARSMVDALNSGNHNRIGALMRASHESLRDDYEVSSRELDLMAESAWAAPGCIGARMTGAGFGGACVALVEKAELGEFTESVNQSYFSSSGVKGEVLPCQAVDGAHIFWSH